MCGHQYSCRHLVSTSKWYIGQGHSAADEDEDEGWAAYLTIRIPREYAQISAVKVSHACALPEANQHAKFVTKMRMRNVGFQNMATHISRSALPHSVAISNGWPMRQKYVSS